MYFRITGHQMSPIHVNTFHFKQKLSIKRIAETRGSGAWEPLSQVGGGDNRCQCQEKVQQLPNLIQSSPHQSWASGAGRSCILPPLSWVLGLFHSAGCPPTPRCWTPPGCVLLACRVLSHLSRVWGELCLHPSIPPSSSPPPAMHSHPPTPPAEAQEARYRGN